MNGRAASRCFTTWQRLVRDCGRVRCHQALAVVPNVITHSAAIRASGTWHVAQSVLRTCLCKKLRLDEISIWASRQGCRSTFQVSIRPSRLARRALNGELH